MNRRKFLKVAGCLVASAGTIELFTACTPVDRVAPDDAFPQGVASGDPRPISIVLWTRANPLLEIAGSVDVTVEVALDEDFAQVVLRQTFGTNTAADYTLRVVAENLVANTIYFYRFWVEGYRSRTGRTWTAPLATDSLPINFAFVSCQDYTHGFFGAYRRILNDDLAREPAEQLRFILHLGDFIYETRNESYQTPLDEHFDPIAQPLVDGRGRSRIVTPFPDGGVTSTGIQFANSVADYRHLYKTFLNDPDLQAARARWPFIHTWDDHEFSDDCWQTEANYHDTGPSSSTDEPSQPRRVAANQAWFEYTPVNLRALDDVTEDLRAAEEFKYAEVGTTPNTVVDSNNQVVNADNQVAINTITIYRNFRFGDLVELLITDNRSYRSDHALPEDISGNYSLFLHPRAALPLDMVNAMDAGRTANNNDPDLLLFVGEFVFNPRYRTPPGTMLGAQQKAWWKQVMQRSSARWKLWGNSVPAQRFRVDVSKVLPQLPDIILSSDSWDGYRTERNELMRFLRDNQISNVISFAGDLHAHFAGLVYDDYENTNTGASGPQAQMAEFVTASISSMSQFAAVEQLARRDVLDATQTTLRHLITFDSTQAATPGADDRVVNLNTTLRFGARAAVTVARDNTRAAVENNRDPSFNAHLRYADTAVHGFGLVRVTRDSVTTQLVSVDSIINESGAAGPAILRTATFVVPYTEAGGTINFTAPTIEGELPFPLSLGVTET